eukprot:UN11497
MSNTLIELQKKKLIFFGWNMLHSNVGGWWSSNVLNWFVSVCVNFCFVFWRRK